MRTLLPFGARRKKWLWMWLGLELGALIGWLLWWWLKEQPQAEPAKPTSQLILPLDENTPPAPPRPKKTPAPAPVSDDLTQVSGIGPKYAQILAEAGVKNFNQLAATPPEDLQTIFRAAIGRTPNVAPWIEQAAELIS
ncbi:MAG: DUF4332 domain-containing protein [Anaerolineae bacterium]|nr:DUF4332 domain-containing protein [Anaerolineae bacterium]MBL6965608.1 DUF4332 domain-containing protein [Anaerolineales bacterium]